MVLNIFMYKKFKLKIYVLIKICLHYQKLYEQNHVFHLHVGRMPYVVFKTTEQFVLVIVT